MINNEYKTPRERVSDEFRRAIDNDRTVFAVFSGNSNKDYSPHGKSDRAGGGMYKRTCEIHGRGSFPREVCDMPSLAMVYSPCQEFENIYDTETALERGTLFFDLEFPFEAAFCGSCMTPGRNGGQKR